MGSIHQLWALLKIGPPQWELCPTWLLCLTSASLRIGSATYFCLSSLFCLVVQWISIWLCLYFIEKSCTTSGFASQGSKRTYSKQNLGAHLKALMNNQWGFMLNDSCKLWKNTPTYLIGKSPRVFSQTIWLGVSLSYI